jgi:hypothetical protein
LLESVRLARHVSLHWGEASARNPDARRAAHDFKLALWGKAKKKKKKKREKKRIGCHGSLWSFGEFFQGLGWTAEARESSKRATSQSTDKASETRGQGRMRLAPSEVVSGKRVCIGNALQWQFV